jgi:hypothetical protein
VPAESVAKRKAITAGINPGVEKGERVSDGLKNKVIDVLLAALLTVLAGAVGMLWSIKADAATVAQVDAVAKEKIESLRVSQASLEKRFDRVEEKIDSLRDLVTQALKGK